ncbi:MAG TPA: phosphatidylserine decarboxylase [Woeseiaceae bacterium]|nr:phosphatidylserine decarboxylase [Woeseiaceae bacterium]
MNDKRGYFVAAEGIPFLLVMVLVTGLTWNFGGIARAWIPFLLLVSLYLVFRDPRRVVPPVALGVVSPVDGKIVEIGTSDTGAIEGGALRIVIRIDIVGTYTARSPVEGKVMDLNALTRAGTTAEKTSGLWVSTDEGENVVLQFHGNRFGIAPRGFLQYGERVGQGQRCAYLRLTKFAEVALPTGARVLVSQGQHVSAGEDLLANLPHP